ncbi:MAG: hypothetical protein GF310_08220, partial [candidate division Zixibacteria bacterium]|nr:hypothetical protein [candidate division Zixibacteria bacterium]
MTGIMKDFMYGLLQDGDKIVIGLSGGPDSVCLAHVLNSLKQEKALELYLAHVNYKLRGEDSELDAKFCRQL